MDFSSIRMLAQGVFLFLVLSTMAEGTKPRTILVGDSQGWRAGTNYTQWAIQNSPFHINDTLGKSKIKNPICVHLISQLTILFLL